MAKKLLIEASHAEELRVALVTGKQLEEFDSETAIKKINKGNIYLAKVMRVEPSLQAAFVEYGGGRQGFLPFSEIHMDYYQIPVSEREAFLKESSESEETETVDLELDKTGVDVVTSDDVDIDYNQVLLTEPATAEVEIIEDVAVDGEHTFEGSTTKALLIDKEEVSILESDVTPVSPELSNAESDTEDSKIVLNSEEESTSTSTRAVRKIRGRRRTKKTGTVADEKKEKKEKKEPSPRFRYKIQEVIKRRQILLVQVNKEERGNKGAALTTYLSLAGRYCVLMPNAQRSLGGVSRKIDDSTDRTRLKEVVDSLNLPDGMSLIVRTAGQDRKKTEIKRDYDYLVSLWNKIREKTLESVAPSCIHEEGDLVTRTLRDLYNQDIDEVLVEGEEAYKSAKNLMKQMMPSHAKKIKSYKKPELPLFHAYDVENQLDSIMNPTCKLPSGGYIVINPTEALVSIDINSGKSTRERNIDETAVKTNIEAAQEIARQLKLRDLSGLVVIDFIDMQDNKHIQQVEQALKDALKKDRARLRIGRISQFGLLEMSRQRLKPSIMESYASQCANCHGTGSVRSIESAALQIIRSIESAAIKGGGVKEIIVQVPSEVDLYILNKKRAHLLNIEQRFNLVVSIERDASLLPPLFNVDVIKEVKAPAEKPADDSEVSEARQQNNRKKNNNKNKNKQRPQQRSDESVVPAKDLSVNDDTTTEDEPTEKKQPQHNRQKKRPHHKHKPKNNTAEQKAIDPIVKTPENKPEIVVNTDSSSDDISKKKTRKNWLQRLLKD
ncbi:MAG: ribonuclease E/G [Alphaproteobacteria bacterium CG_4_10_14_0_8_um_filter_37_21]|nr:MAG: ribonuclease E/G [Alphaproteobacteria bacterium CG_4_10_14_0_8_um_filter_37_21]